MTSHNWKNYPSLLLIHIYIICSVLTVADEKQKFCPTNHLSLNNAGAPEELASNSSGRFPHTGDGGFLIQPAGREEPLEEEYVYCADHQPIVQLVAMGFVF